MTPDPKTGLVEVLDLGPTQPTRKGVEPGPPLSIKMFPVDAKEAFAKQGKLPDDTPRFVLAESYVAPDPA